MVRTKVILVLCFAAAFAAGGTAGYVVKSTTDVRPHGYSRLMEELRLSDRQREQMREIWASIEPNASQQREQRRLAAEERDKEIAALMTPEQQPKYEQIRQDYDRKIAELSSQRKLAFDRAVERTKREVLTPEQAQKYEEILKKQREGESGGGPPWSGTRGRRGGPSPAEVGAGARAGGPRATRPATDEPNAPE